jgi:hypothetical protein
MKSRTFSFLPRIKLKLSFASPPLRLYVIIVGTGGEAMGQKRQSRFRQCRVETLYLDANL